jgi:hypothetical protein
MDQIQNKIFYLGFHKTGTTSFGVLMRSLGFRRQSYYKPYSASFINNLEQNDLGELFALADNAEAFEDDPWYLFYEVFEKRYPSAKFVFYERNAEDWYQSCLFFFGRYSTPMSEFIFGRGKGSPLYNKKHHIEVYKQHASNVRQYFQNKQHKFLEIPDFSDRSAQELARFLGKDPAGVTFPRENVNKLSKYEKTVLQLRLKAVKMLRLGEVYRSED